MSVAMSTFIDGTVTNLQPVAPNPSLSADAQHSTDTEGNSQTSNPDANVPKVRGA